MMKTPLLVTNSYLLIALLLSSCSYAQKTPTIITQNLDDYQIRSSYEDTVGFSAKNIYAVRLYKSTKAKTSKIFKNKAFELVSYTEYLPDGRRRYKKYTYSNIARIEKYHYDQAFNNLILLETSENNKEFNYNWLFYDKNSNLIENFGYKTLNATFYYESYIRYHIGYSKNETKIEVAGYNSDTTASPVQTYVFSPSFLTKAKPQYQYKFQKFKLINNSYQPIQAQGFVFDDRNVDYTYDNQGFITSEIWHKPANQLENKTEYFYSKDHKERVQQDYHMLGTEKSTKKTRKFDQFNNLIWEQSIEYTGNPLDITQFEYVYDAKGNWIEKKTYVQSSENGAYGAKKLVAHEIREIEYYKPDQAPRAFTLPLFTKQAKETKNNIPKWSAEKPEKVDEDDDIE